MPDARPSVSSIHMRDGVSVASPLCLSGCVFVVPEVNWQWSFQLSYGISQAASLHTLRHNATHNSTSRLPAPAFSRPCSTRLPWTRPRPSGAGQTRAAAWSANHFYLQHAPPVISRSRAFVSRQAPPDGSLPRPRRFKLSRRQCGGQGQGHEQRQGRLIRAAAAV